MKVHFGQETKGSKCSEFNQTARLCEGARREAAHHHLTAAAPPPLPPSSGSVGWFCTWKVLWKINLGDGATNTRSIVVVCVCCLADIFVFLCQKLWKVDDGFFLRRGTFQKTQCFHSNHFFLTVRLWPLQHKSTLRLWLKTRARCQNLWTVCMWATDWLRTSLIWKKTEDTKAWEWTTQRLCSSSCAGCWPTNYWTHPATDSPNWEWGSGGRAARLPIRRSVVRSSAPLVYMSKCPWARYRTPHCSLLWMSVWMCVNGWMLTCVVKCFEQLKRPE